MAGFVLGDSMSWQEVLKEKKVEAKPVAKPIEKQKVKDFPIKPDSATFKIWQAASKDDTWADYTKDGLTSSQVQSVQRAKRLLQGEVVNIRGTDFQLKDRDAIGDVNAIISRLDNITPKKTSLQRKRGNVTADVKRFIENEKYDELLNLLEGRGQDKYAGKLSDSAKRARMAIQESKMLKNKILSGAEDKHPELVRIKEILKIGGVPQIEINQTIPEPTVVSYIKKIMALNFSKNSRNKTDFIYENANDQLARNIFGNTKILPSLEFILDNEGLNESNIPTSYKKRNVIENIALQKLIAGVLSEDNKNAQKSINSIYNKYKEDIEAFYGREGETPEEAEKRQTLRNESRGKWDAISRKGNKARRDFFAEIREDDDTNAYFEDLMAEVTKDKTNKMTPEIRDELVDALQGRDPEGFTDALRKLGIQDTFDDMEEINEELNTQKTIDALGQMKKLPNGLMRPVAGTEETLRYFDEQEVDAWSILEDVIDDDITTFDTGQTGTLDKIVIIQKRLGELYDVEPEIDEEDVENGDMTSEEFKQLILDTYSPIRKAFLEGVAKRMKDISAEGKVLGKKIKSSQGGFVEPAIWIQIQLGVSE